MFSLVKLSALLSLAVALCCCSAPLRTIRCVAAAAASPPLLSAQSSSEPSQAGARTAGDVEVYFTSADKSILFERLDSAATVVTHSANEQTRTESSGLGQQVPVPRPPQQSGPDAIFQVDDSTKFQSVLGFGAALSDSSAYLLHRMMQTDPLSAHRVLLSLFGRDCHKCAGLSYLRLTISSCDFSLTDYTYSNRPDDYDLNFVSLEHDQAYVLPVLREILKINPNITLLVSPWSAPAWMKTTRSLVKGQLREDMVSLYARYYVKVLALFRSAGITVHYLTLVNEPDVAANISYPGTGLPTAHAVMLTKLIVPAIRSAGLVTRVLLHDTNWVAADKTCFPVLRDKAAAALLHGVAWHCYAGEPSVQSKVHDMFSGRLETHVTECSSGDWMPDWWRSLVWSFDVVYKGSLDNWARAVARWNLVLDEQDGPTWHDCRGKFCCPNCLGTLRVHSDMRGVDFNHEFYGMAHFAHFWHTAHALAPPDEPATRRIATEHVAGVTCVRAVSVLDEVVNRVQVMLVNNCTATATDNQTDSGARVVRFVYRSRAVEVLLPSRGLATVLFPAIAA